MLKNLQIKQKFTVLLLVILIVGVSVSGTALSFVLRQNAKREVTNTALVLMETMNSVRNYTSTQINPELQDRLAITFLPQSVPAYSAREVFENLRTKKEYKDFFYKEATLNPTNLRDKADSFETKIVERFKTQNKSEVTGFRSLPGGDIFYIARPLTVTQQSCLQCHSTVAAAPPSIIERYGSAHGFGWKLNEIIGAQVISVPADRVIEKANKSFAVIIGIVSLVFTTVIISVNMFLNRQVIRPLKRITRVAEDVSTGHMEVDFDAVSNDEIGNLARAFKRMKLSLEMAMKRLKNTGHSSQNRGESF
ncbi:MAG: DUF3365 domain-containing protein [Cyanobacteria bacterium J06621_15]